MAGHSLVLSAAMALALAVPSLAAAPLDTSRIHEAYLEGDFDQATRGIEAHLEAKRPMTHAESVFVFKHLGVMYAASKATQEKGKHYMFRLIEIEPTARILDMYASDMIHLIFRNVQEDYEAKRARLGISRPSGGEETTGATAPAAAAAPSAPAPQPRPSASGGGKRKELYYWVAGGAAVAAGTMAVVLFLGSGEGRKTKTITVTP